MIAMPEPDRAVLGRRAEIVQALRRIVPGEGVIDHENELRAFESDGLTAYRQPPMVAVLPRDDGAGRRGPALLRREQDQGRPARRRNVALGRRACRLPTAFFSAWASSTRSSTSTWPTAASSLSRA